MGTSGVEALGVGRPPTVVDAIGVGCAGAPVVVKVTGSTTLIGTATPFMRGGSMKLVVVADPITCGGARAATAPRRNRS